MQFLILFQTKLSLCQQQWVNLVCTLTDIVTVIYKTVSEIRRLWFLLLWLSSLEGISLFINFTHRHIKYIILNVYGCLRSFPTSATRLCLRFLIRKETYENAKERARKKRLAHYFSKSCTYNCASIITSSADQNLNLYPSSTCSKLTAPHQISSFHPNSVKKITIPSPKYKTCKFDTFENTIFFPINDNHLDIRDKKSVPFLNYYNLILKPEVLVKNITCIYNDGRPRSTTVDYPQMTQCLNKKHCSLQNLTFICKYINSTFSPYHCVRTTNKDNMVNISSPILKFHSEVKNISDTSVVISHARKRPEAISPIKTKAAKFAFIPSTLQNLNLTKNCGENNFVPSPISKLPSSAAPIQNIYNPVLNEPKFHNLSTCTDGTDVNKLFYTSIINCLLEQKVLYQSSPNTSTKAFSKAGEKFGDKFIYVNQKKVTDLNTCLSVTSCQHNDRSGMLRILNALNLSKIHNTKPSTSNTRTRPTTYHADFKFENHYKLYYNADTYID